MAPSSKKSVEINGDINTAKVTQNNQTMNGKTTLPANDEKSAVIGGERLQLEDIYEQLGGMGTYQWITYMLLGLVGILSAESISMNFVGGDQDHWCYVEELKNLSHSHQKYIAIPINDDGEYEQCEYYDLDYSSYSLDDYINWNRSFFTNASTRSCSEWVYDKSLYINTITRRFDLVCGDSWMISLVSTLFMGGILVGALIAGIVSDKYGRKTALYSGCLLKVAAFLLASFEIHYSVTCIARFLLGVGNSICFLPAFVHVMELVTGFWRTILGVVFQLCFSVGFMIWPGLAYAVRDDVKLQLTWAVPMVWLVTYWWLLDESPMWLLNQQRYEEADRVLRKIAAVNRTSLPDAFDARDIEMKVEEGETKNCSALVTSPTMRIRTLIIALYWFTVSLMYYALSLNTGSLSGDLFINTLISGLVEIPANILCVFFLAWSITGRKITSIVSLLIAGVASFISVYMILEDIGLAHTIFATVSKGFVTMAFSAIYVFSSELLPTEVRNTGMGVASVCARISGMAAPYVGGPLANVWSPLPSVVYGSFAVISSLLVVFLPETRNAPLFKTIEEAEQFGKKTKDTSTKSEGYDVTTVAVKPLGVANAAFENEDTWM